jgi:FlaG/FlaF family flagellin (archaellin)
MLVQKTHGASGMISMRELRMTILMNFLIKKTMTKYLDLEGLKHFKKKIDAEYKPALNGKADNDIGIFTTGVATPEFHVNSNNADEKSANEVLATGSNGTADILIRHSNSNGAALDLVRVNVNGITVNSYAASLSLSGENINAKDWKLTGLKTNITGDSITSPKIVKAGGTSSEILMADGSVKDFVSLSSIPLTGSINLTTENAVTLAAKYAKVANNSINFYVIADSRGKLPSSETRININSGIASLVGAEGANVGDLFVVGKLSLKPVYKIIPLNDAKAENSTYKGTQGVVTPWDKSQINKIASIESTANAAKNNMPTYGESNMNNALRTGMYPWCTLGRLESYISTYLPAHRTLNFELPVRQALCPNHIYPSSSIVA